MKNQTAKKLLFAAFGLCALLLGQSVLAVEIQSLRGENAIDETLSLIHI